MESMDEYLLQRQYEEPPAAARDHRHATERDRDRVLHSSAFRRLQGKTQVIGIGQADFYRTRLTHSIETAQIARAIANNMLVEEPRLRKCLTEELAEAVALAHDLGHPPFGHAGERSLDACMRDVSGRAQLQSKQALRFEGNAHTFHVLVAVEPKSPDYPGLNLTRAMLSGVIKYPYEQDTGNERFIFPSDEGAAVWALSKTAGLMTAKEIAGGSRPLTSIVCQILDWADDCAYSIHDIEDALQAQFLRPGDLEDRGFARRVLQHYQETRENEAVPPSSLEEICLRLKDLKARMRVPDRGDERAHRKQALRNILNELITEVSVQPRHEPGERPDYAWNLIVPVESRILSALCKSVVWEAVITDPRVAAMSAKGKEILHDLFSLLLSELVEKKSCVLFPRYYRPIVEESMQKGEIEAARSVCNFLALLTDMDALRLHALLRGSKASSIFDLI
jgi:dGTPase